MFAELSQLGKKVDYDPHYDSKKLFPIARKTNRETIGIFGDVLPFYGYDLWNHYEVSWLNEKGKPCVAVAEILYACDSPNIIEAKAMKCYFHSFNNTCFKDTQTVQMTLERDLAAQLKTKVWVKLIPLTEWFDNKRYMSFEGDCIDDLDIECSVYTVDPSLLSLEKPETDIIEEVFYSNLLKSNCLVTKQPDWGRVQIQYRGKKIDRASLLKYLISFRNHYEFNEQCIERIFIDIMKQCQPEKLTVIGRYTPRGGIDINPCRSTHPVEFPR